MQKGCVGWKDLVTKNQIVHTFKPVISNIDTHFRNESFKGSSLDLIFKKSAITLILLNINKNLAHFISVIWSGFQPM